MSQIGFFDADKRLSDPAKNRQKDKDARWTRKNGRSLFGYKNHVNADAQHKLIREYGVTDASVHDSQGFDELLVTRRARSMPTVPTARRRSSRI